MSSSVSVVNRLEHVRDLIFLHNNFIRNVFSYANFQRSQKRHCYQLYRDTLFPGMFLKSFNKLAGRVLKGYKATRRG